MERTGDYMTYVFQLVDVDDAARIGNKYVLCTQFPNWEHRQINIDEVGYLQFKEIVPGIHTWFDGSEFKNYNYYMIQFIKFVPEHTKADDTNYTLD